MEASAICRSFEANAWRSDLCAHCFQSREEHAPSSAPSSALSSSSLNQGPPVRNHGDRYQSLMSSYRHPVASASRSVIAAPQRKVAGILKLKGGDRDVISSSSVRFAAADDVIIGYGGHECFEEHRQDSLDSDSDDEDRVPDTEEERKVIDK